MSVKTADLYISFKSCICIDNKIKIKKIRIFGFNLQIRLFAHFQQKKLEYDSVIGVWKIG